MNRFCIFAAIAISLSVPQLAFAQKKAVPPGKPATTHSHPSKGPHGGELVELGAEEYHVELVVQEKQNRVDIYLLDSNAKLPVAIDATFVALNVKLDAKPTQLKLLPVVQENEVAGMNSRFSLTSSELISALHSKGGDARITVKIGKKSYVVKLAHNHDHENHAKATSPTKR
jgi:hypothetical protein